MKKSLLSSFALAAVALLSPLSSQAQCPAGYTTTQTSTGFTCTAINGLPEISASASIGGTAVLLCGAVMLRRRKGAAGAI